MISIRGILPIFKNQLTEKKVMEGLAVETGDQGTVYLYFTAKKDGDDIVRVAKSDNGLDFSLDHQVSRLRLKPKKFTEIENLIKPRKDFFDNLPIQIEGVVDLEKGWLVVYHVADQGGNVLVGASMFSKDTETRELWRSDTPLWESSTGWSGKKIKFVGLAYLKGQIIGYWGVANKAIFAVIYPSYKTRSRETGKFCHIGYRHFLSLGRNIN